MLTAPVQSEKRKPTSFADGVWGNEIEMNGGIIKHGAMMISFGAVDGASIRIEARTNARGA